MSFPRFCLPLAAALLLAACRGGSAPGPVQFIEEGMPESLAAWNVLYVADGKLQLNQRVEPYDLNTPLFTDYAHKLRTVWMPEGTAARYQPEESFDFPVGTIISKTFYYPVPENGSGSGDTVLRSDDSGPGLQSGGLELAKVRLVETRLLVHRADGWVALPYVWNAEQTEARLMRAGDLVPLQLVAKDGAVTPLDYVVPDQNQCAGCHGTDLRSKAVFPIGPKARHLNRDFAYADGAANQLERWQSIGYLTDVPARDVPRAAVWNDDSIDQDARARLPRHQLRSLPQRHRSGQDLGHVAQCRHPRTVAAGPLQVADRRRHRHRWTRLRHRAGRPASVDPCVPYGEYGSGGDDAGGGPQPGPCGRCAVD